MGDALIPGAGDLRCRRLPGTVSFLMSPLCASAARLYTMRHPVQWKNDVKTLPRHRAADLAYGVIRQGVMSGRWPSGAHLREVELASELGVSRTPVREALRRLASEGVLKFEPHIGATVPNWSAADLDEIFDLRSRLESYAAELAASRADETTIAAMREATREMERAAFSGQSPDTVAVTANNDRFHQLIVTASGSKRLATFIASVVELPLVVRTFARFDAHAMRRSIAHHDEIIEAISNRDPVWAGAVMRAHIQAGRHVMLGDRSGPE